MAPIVPQKRFLGLFNSLLPAVAASVYLLIVTFFYQLKMRTNILRLDIYVTWVLGFVCWFAFINKHSFVSGKNMKLCLFLVLCVAMETIIVLPDEASWYSFLSIVSYSGIFLFYRSYFKAYRADAIILMIAPVFLAQLVMGWQSAMRNQLDSQSITGWFYNSGYYANFIIASIPVFLLSLSAKKNTQYYFRIILAVLTITTITLIFLTKSRSALLGLSAGFLVIIWPRVSTWFRRNMRFLRQITVIILTGCILFLGLLLYKQKELSAIGRLTIYKVTLNIISDHVVLGVGPGRFASVYNEYQSNYFQENNVSVSSQQLAKDVFEAFNLILQIIAEYGILVFAIVLLLLSTIVKDYINQPPDRIKSWVFYLCVASIVALSVSGLFSNPFHATPIMASAVLQAACAASFLYIPSKKEGSLTSNSRIWVHGVFLICAVSLGILLQRKVSAELNWKKASDLASIDDFKSANPFYTASFPMMQYNGYFLYNYGSENAIAGNLDSTIYLLERSLNYLSTSNTHLYLGDAYKRAGRFKEAENEYKKAMYMVPSHFYPRLQLIRLFKELGDSISYRYWIHESLNRPIKISSEETLAIIDSIRVQ